MSATRAGLTSAAALMAAAAGAWLYGAIDDRTPAVQHSPDSHLESAPKLVLASPPGATEGSASGATATAPVVILTGVAVNVDGSNVAIASVNRGAQTLLRVGDPIGPFASILRIDDASMTYRFAGRDLRVFVQAPQRVSQAAPRQATPPAYLAVAGTPAPAASALGLEPGSGNAAFRQAVEKKIQALTTGR